MTGLIHLDAIPEQEVLIVGPAPDVDVRNGFVNAFYPGQRLYGLQDVGFG